MPHNRIGNIDPQYPALSSKLAWNRLAIFGPGEDAMVFKVLQEEAKDPGDEDDDRDNNSDHDSENDDMDQPLPDDDTAVFTRRGKSGRKSSNTDAALRSRSKAQAQNIFPTEVFYAACAGVHVALLDIFKQYRK